MSVILADRNKTAVEAVAQSIRQEGGDCSSFEVDVADAASVGDMLARVASEIGPVHALFNNAGTPSNASIETIRAAEWKRTIDTHVKGTFLCTQGILRQMCARGAGVIVNMSSDYAVKGMANGGAYAAAKTAIYSLTKSLAAEFASHGIRVNAVGPGPIETPLLRGGMTEEEWNAHKANRGRLVPMGRLGQPSEVASVVDFLLSDRSSYMTGQIIHPNGGQISW